MQNVFLSFHIYLIVVTLWHIVLLIQYDNNCRIPQHIRDSFDKENGEASYFCMSIMNFLSGVGFIIEVIFLLHQKSYSPLLVVLALGAIGFFILGAFFLSGWLFTAHQNQPTRQ